MKTVNKKQVRLNNRIAECVLAKKRYFHLLNKKQECVDNKKPFDSEFKLKTAYKQFMYFKDVHNQLPDPPRGINI